MERPAVCPALKVWYVAFVDYGRNLWWHRFTRAGFRHCFAFAFDPDMGVWLVFDPTLEGFVVRPIPRSVVDALIAEVWGRGGRILKCRAEGKAPRRPRLFATCVTVIAHLLGLPRCAVRPDGLYRLLLARGAVPLEREAADAGPVRQNAKT